MTHPSIASAGNASNDLQPGPAPERHNRLHEKPNARPHVRDDFDTARLCASHNPLVAAASRLLSNIARLKPHKEPEQIASLRVRLGKRVEHFTRLALQAGVEGKDVKVASYVLCTVADEAVLTSDWGRNSTWANDNLLHAFHTETSGGARLFQLLEHYMSVAAGNVQMLELMYLCLALGFEGRYAATEKSGKGLQRLRDELFQCIQRQRGEVSTTISRVALPRRQDQRGHVLLVPGWLPVLLTLFSLGLLYSAFTWKLDQQREKALIPFKQFDASLNVPGNDRGFAR